MDEDQIVCKNSTKRSLALWMGMVVTSVDVRISIMVPKLFSLVPTHKIEAAMKASALGSTKAALRTVCDAVGEAWMTYHAAGGLTRV